MDKKINIIVVGAGGRMGRMLCQEISRSETMCLVGAIEKGGSPAIGSDIATYGGTGPAVRIMPDWIESIAETDVVIDFSTPESTMGTVGNLVQHNLLRPHKKVALVIGTTGLDAEQLGAIGRSMEISYTSCVLSSNFSLGVNAMAGVVKKLSALLRDWDPEIAEIHHREKKDAPSGTAKMLGEVIAEARGRKFADVAILSRAAMLGKRMPEEIGVTAIRGGDVVGEHTVYFFGDKERIEVHHESTDRITFVRGALAAAKWLPEKPWGLYNMQDVLGF